ncbi:MAG TPA: branched-chain amino acid ABC transporter substrate-binding protein [Solirubrobacteraceae bacterium]|nr:branched-chain amino acid ABC transporter substrate-binding protein [Solirubrobacteraceae bacterium]
MRRISTFGAARIAVAAAVVAAGSVGSIASSSAKTARAAAGATVDFYSSLPTVGSSSAQTIPAQNGMKLALKLAGYKAGHYSINYTPMDDATASQGQWTPAQTSADARKAASDPKAVYYMGEFNSGASEVSMPILNRAGIPQDSPANTYVGLTASLKGVTAKGEPGVYFPTGKRTYTRIVPLDTIQGAADLDALKMAGCTKLAIFDDTQAYGAGLAAVLKDTAHMYGMQVVSVQSNATPQTDYSSVAQQFASAGAQCVEVSATTASVGGTALVSAIHSALPKATVLGPDGMCTSAWVTDEKVLCTVATLDMKAYPGGKRFLAAYKKAYGVANPDPYSIYGYESAVLGINALKTLPAGLSGAKLRSAMVKALFAGKMQNSVLGNFKITKTGDTNLTSYGLYKLAPHNTKADTLTFDKTLHPTKYLHAS